MAAPNQVTVCHAGGTATEWEAKTFNVNGLNGHDGHPSDIIPPNESLPDGLNWTNAGKILYIANCAPLPPGEEPPVYPPVDPPVVVVDPPVVVVDPPAAAVETPVVQSPVVVQTPVTTVTPTAQTPAATVQTPAVTGAAAVSQGTNQGFNAQTAVGGTEGAPTWLAGLGLMLGAGAVVAVRRRSLGAQAD
ncbi:MAG TPA: hypothetical protein VIQ52_06105 [Arthrobacter sp.]